MAIVKGFKDGKRPVVELTRVQAVVDGHHFTQYPMKKGTGELENGMLVSVDHIAGEIGKATDVTQVAYLHASVEHMYEDKGRDEFVVKEIEDFLPRVYSLRTGDKYETNAVIWDSTEFADGYADIKEAIDEKTPVYAYVDIATGYTKLTKTADGTVGTDLRVVAVIYLPNGTRGVKLGHK